MSSLTAEPTFMCYNVFGLLKDLKQLCISFGINS